MFYICIQFTGFFQIVQPKNIDFPQHHALLFFEISAALSLAWEVFSKYEAPVYSEEGTKEFRRCLHDENYLAGITYYGAFGGETLIGEIGIRFTPMVYH